MTILVQLLLGISVIAAIAGAVFLAFKGLKGWGWLIFFAVLGMFELSHSVIKITDTKPAFHNAKEVV